MAQSFNNYTPSSRDALAAKRKSREDEHSDPGTDTTRRITDSANSSLSPPIKEGISQNRRILPLGSDESYLDIRFHKTTGKTHQRNFVRR